MDDASITIELTHFLDSNAADNYRKKYVYEFIGSHRLHGFDGKFSSFGGLIFNSVPFIFFDKACCSENGNNGSVQKRKVKLNHL